MRSLLASSCSRDVGGLHVPARLRVVEQRRIAAPAVRIGVQVGLGAQQPAVSLQRRDDVGVGLLDEAPGEVGDSTIETAAGVDRVLQRDPVLLSEPEVVLAEGDRGVHEPGPLLGGDEVGQQHRVAAGAVVGDVVEGRLVRSVRRGPCRGSERSPRPLLRAPSRPERWPSPRPLRPAAPARTRSPARRRPRRWRSASRGSSSRPAAGRRAAAGSPGSRRSGAGSRIGSFT